MTEKENYWIQIAAYDLETAKAMLDAGRYLYVGFMCHQSIEKILKGVFTIKSETVPPKIHNLARLLQLTKLDSDIPDDLLETLNELNPLNIATGYPDQEFEIIQDFDYDYSSELLEKTRGLFEWIKTKI